MLTDLTQPEVLASTPGIQSTAYHVVLVEPSQLLPLRWVEFVRRPRVHLVTLMPQQPDPFTRLFALLDARFASLTHGEIASRILEGMPRLLPMETTVRIVVAASWDIRTPADLTRNTGVPHRSLRDNCRQLGLKRIEHLITVVRENGIRFLVSRGLSVRRAQCVMGVSDPSNFRRQTERTRYFISHPPSSA